jgi:hypothetical protein
VFEDGKLIYNGKSYREEMLNAQDLLDPEITSIDDLPLIRDAINAIYNAINAIRKPFGPGMTIWHDNRPPGLSVNEMRQRGWAVEDGTTYEAQLVSTGYFSIDDLAYTGPTQNLINPYTNRGGLFVRAGATAGIAQEDAVQAFKIKVTYSGLAGRAWWLDLLPYPYDIVIEDPVNVGSPLRTATETRPANISRIPMIYALKQ